jgi:hypothetical protein
MLSYRLDGRPLFGIEAFAATEPSAVPLLLSGQLVTYSYTHQRLVGQPMDAGFSLLPSFERPHYTVRLDDDETDEIDRLVQALGTAHRNPYHGLHRRQGGNRS